MSVDPEAVDWGKIAKGGEYSLEDAVAARRAEEAEAADPHGIISALQQDGGTEAISADDLPEEPDAYAGALAAQIHYLFEGPDELHIPTDPKFEAMLGGMREGLAEIARMRIEGAPRYELGEAAMRWDNEHNEDWAGTLVRILPTKKGCIWLNDYTSNRAMPTELGDTIEGTIMLTSISSSVNAGGSIALYDATYRERHREKGVRPKEPREHSLPIANIYEIFYLNRKDQELPVTDGDFIQAVALAEPA